jgi:hypothetical protein
MLNWTEVKNRAALLGVTDTSSDRTTVIRQIQVAEGNVACYKTKTVCDQMGCCWRDECIGRRTAKMPVVKPNG